MSKVETAKLEITQEIAAIQELLNCSWEKALQEWVVLNG